MTLRVTSLQAETLDMKSFDGKPNLVVTRVLVVVTDGDSRMQWFSSVEDAPRIGEVWIGGLPSHTDQEARRG